MARWTAEYTSGLRKGWGVFWEPGVFFRILAASPLHIHPHHFKKIDSRPLNSLPE